MTPRRWTGIILALLWTGSLAACRRDARSPLVREFAGSYPAETRPTGAVREFEIIAAEAQVDLGAGHKLRVWAYNGQVPGPTLRVRLGDTLRVRLVNRLPQPTTIHWHGVRVPNAMDGVPYLTQPPVEPGGSFVYEFTPKDAGTFWFHPHIRSSEQVERGLQGVLIVEDATPPPYSRDVVWVLDDWLLDEAGQVFGRFNTPHDLAHDGRWGNLVTVNGRTDTRLILKGGERFRLRLINTANGRVFLPVLPGLQAKVIAADGLYLRAPTDYQGLELAPGNRLDLDVVVPTGTSSVVAVSDRFLARQSINLASIVVDGIAPAQPLDFRSPARAHVPRWSDALSQPVTKELRLNARRGGPLGIEWTINEHAFEGHDHHGAPALTIRAGTFNRLRLTNESFRLHPFHIHGMFFRVLARDGRPVDEGHFRDTVLVHGRETVDIGLVPLDAGTWMIHCHILEHAEAGMMSTIRVTGG